MQADIIIVGGGIAGLAAARNLAEKGWGVTVLEASHRLGGRIHTVYDPNFDSLLETGPEFIHGEQPITMQLLQEAGIPYYPTEGKQYRHFNGNWLADDDPADDWQLVLDRMQSLKKDMPLINFLEQHFPGSNYENLRKSIRQYAEGFDAADTHLASTLSLRDEWLQDEQELYRIKGGHSRLSAFLVQQCTQLGVDFQLNSVVQQVQWSKGNVKVLTGADRVFTTKRLLVTVPIKVLQRNSEVAGIQFNPALNAQLNAADKIGFGTVIKCFFQFNHPFWESHVPNAGLLISQQVVPTWWTQLPYSSNMLTGWLGGPGAKAMRGANDEVLLKVGLESLANLFSIDAAALRAQLLAWRFADWSTVPAVAGAYSYATTETAIAKSVLNMPVEQTIYFAGEALSATTAPGTIEAALSSAKLVCEQLLQTVPTISAASVR